MRLTQRRDHMSCPPAQVYTNATLGRHSQQGNVLKIDCITCSSGTFVFSRLGAPNFQHLYINGFIGKIDSAGKHHRDFSMKSGAFLWKIFQPIHWSPWSATREHHPGTPSAGETQAIGIVTCTTGDDLPQAHMAPWCGGVSHKGCQVMAIEWLMGKLWKNIEVS